MDKVVRFPGPDIYDGLPCDVEPDPAPARLTPDLVDDGCRCAACLDKPERPCSFGVNPAQQPVLLIGAGAEPAHGVEALRAAGALVRVVGRAIRHAVMLGAGRHRVTAERRRYSHTGEPPGGRGGG